MRLLFLILILAIFHPAANAQIAKGAGVFYFVGEPTLTPNVCYDAEIGIDTTTGFWWEYSRDLNMWILAGFRIQEIDTCIVPNYTPVDKQSEIVLNSCDSLYRWRAGAWHHLNPSGDNDSDPTNEAWTISDGTNSELITNETVTFTGSGGAVVTYSTSTNTLTVNAGSSTGGDNWGTQVVQIDANQLSGDGTSGNVLDVAANGITNNEMADNAIGSAEVINNSLTAGDLLVDVVSSIDGVTNDGGDIDLIAGSGISITPNDAANTITIANTGDLSATNELQTLANTSAATTHTVTLSASGGSVQLAEGSGITLTTTGTTLDGVVTIAAVDASATNESLTISDGTDSENLGGQTLTVAASGIATVDYVPATNTLTIGAVEVDGAITNEGILGVGAGTGTTSIILSNTSGANGVTLAAGGIIALSETTSSNGGTITITATEVDGSVTNELQTLANTSAATTHTVTLSASGGSVQLVEGSGITLTTTGTTLDGIVTIASVEVDGSITNEGILGVGAGIATTSIITSNTSGANGVTLAAGGIIALSETTSSNGGTITITATEVDGSVTNEALTISDGVDSENLGGQTLTVSASGIATVDYVPATNTLTIGAVEVDGSITNELQTFSNTSNATTHTVTLSNSGGSVQLAEGSGITLTTTGTALDGVVTIAAVDASTTNESLTISDGTDSENLGGQTLTVSATGIATVDYVPATNTLTIGAVEVDGSITNEGSLTVSAGTATTSIINSNTSGSTGVTISVAGILSISESGNVITLTGTEVDGSITNELQTLANTSAATTHTVTLSASGGSLQLAEGSGITLTTTGTTLDGVVTIAAVDESTTNESLTISDGVDSENLGGQTLTVSATGIATVDYVPATNTLTIGAVEVDGAITNEGILGVAAGISTTSIITSNTSGANGVTLAAGGIVSLSETTSSNGGTITITATEVDGSVTNEALTISDGVDSENLGGQTLTVSATGIATVDYVPASNTLTIGAVEVDGSVTNELQTFSNTSNATTHTVTLSASGGSVQLAEGSGITLSTTGTALDGVVTIAAVDASATNESLTISDGTDSENLGGQTLTVSATGIATVDYVPATNTLTIGAVEVDGSITNEGILGVGAGISTTSIILSNTSGANGVTLAAGGIISLSETTSSNGGTITITATEIDGSVTNEALTISDGVDSENLGGQTLTVSATGIATVDYVPASNTLTIGAVEVDGSVTNELQTFSNTSNATTHTVTLSNSGGSVQLAEGSGITLTTTGTTLDGVVTIAAVDASTTNESLTISDGVDSENLGGQTLTVAASGIATVDYVPASNTLTIGAVEVDGSVTNELQTFSNTSNATTHTVTLSASGGSVQLAEGSGITLSTTGTTLDGVVTIASVEVDGSITNEGILGVGAGIATTSIITSNTSGANGVTLAAGGIISLSETTSSNGGTITITATEIDGSVTNELQTFSNTSNATTHTVTLSNSGGSVQLAEGSGITLTTTGTALDGVVTIATTGGGITGAQNGLYISGSNVRQGTNPLIETTLIDHDGFEYRHSDGKVSFTNQATSYTVQGADFGIEGTESNPTINATPTKDAIIELRASLAGSAQPNSLSIGAYPTDADGIWIQARSQAVPNFEYPLSLQPRGEKMSVGRIGGLDALVTFAGTGLSGSGIAGQVLHLENSEGNGKTSMSLGAGTDALDSEIAWFDAADALRITNRSNTAGTSTVRVAIGGETSDIAIFQTSSTAPNSRFGIGFNNPANVTSTLQSGGSFAGGILTTVGSVTLDERHYVVIFTGNTNQTWTLPTASTCTGRQYILAHRNTTATVTLSVSVNKGNGGNFSTLSPGEWATIWSDGSAWTGFKLTSL